MTVRGAGSSGRVRRERRCGSLKSCGFATSVDPAGGRLQIPMVISDFDLERE